MNAPLTLILGGARCGKTGRALALCEKLAATGRQKLYLATAQAGDAEMAARIDRHRQERAQGGWMLVEEPLRVPGALARLSRPDRVLLLDCLTLWTAALMAADRNMATARRRLTTALRRRRGPLVLVSGEVGLGIVPDNAAARRFSDELGLTNQAVAALADRVWFVAAGLTLPLKGDAA